MQAPSVLRQPEVKQALGSRFMPAFFTPRRGGILPGPGREPAPTVLPDEAHGHGKKLARSDAERRENYLKTAKRRRTLKLAGACPP